MEEEKIKQIRKEVIDYYGTASLINILAQTDLIRVENLSDEEILIEAKKIKIVK